MPILTDIATVTIGKQKAPDALKALYAFRRTFPKPELNLNTKLRTTLVVGDASKLGTIKLPSESRGIFASWRSELEKVPVHDLYESQPLNTVKDNSSEDIDAMLLEMRHTEWLKEIDASLSKRFAKRSKP